MRTILVLDLIPLKLVADYIAGQPSSDGRRQGRTVNLGYQYVMRHCIRDSCQVYGHTHCAVVFRWLKPVSMSVVSWRRADVVECLGLIFSW